jgi:AraC-like DNA-binding protein
MPDSHPASPDFSGKITRIIEENLSNEQFGVSELAREIGMSRSNLLRKVKKLTNLSVSQFIRQVRLKSAMDMLKDHSLNVSEVSYKVGFGSTSYFIKCFREYYGYPPGEVGRRVLSESDSNKSDPSHIKRNLVILISAILLVVVIAVLLFIVFKPFSSGQKNLEKSIAVLPFKNDSNDSSNVYIINGLKRQVTGICGPGNTAGKQGIYLSYRWTSQNRLPMK